MPKDDHGDSESEIVRIVLPKKTAEQLRQRGQRRGLKLSTFGRMLLMEALAAGGSGGASDNK